MYKIFKRFLDILLALILIPIVIISIILVTICIKIEDGGSIFYLADRIGIDRKIFKMFKFRTMIENAPDIRAEDGSTLNSENDERLTKVGKILRKTSIDELPQILNVLIGQMSFIGPRPDSAMWLNNYTEKEKIIHTVKPGISGYNQVINRNNASTKEKLENDIFYVENISLKLDFKIFFLTIKNVLISKNIYRSSEDEYE